MPIPLTLDCVADEGFLEQRRSVSIAVLNESLLNDVYLADED